MGLWSNPLTLPSLDLEAWSTTIGAVRVGPARVQRPGRRPQSRRRLPEERYEHSHRQDQGRVPRDAAADDLFLRRAAHRGAGPLADAQGSRTRPHHDGLGDGRSPHPRQGGVDRGHAADHQSLSGQTAHLQRRLEDPDLLCRVRHHSLPRAPVRFLAGGRRFYRWQRETTRRDRLAALLGDADRLVRADPDLLHDSRDRARVGRRQVVADVLRTAAARGI